MFVNISGVVLLGSVRESTFLGEKKGWTGQLAVRVLDFDI